MSTAQTTTTSANSTLVERRSKKVGNPPSIAKVESTSNNYDDKKVPSPVCRVDHFPHPPQTRESVLAKKQNEGFLNLLAILIIGWCCIEMHHTYKRSGKYIDFELLFVLLRDFPMHILLWWCVMTFSCFTAVTIEYVFEHYENMRSGFGELVMILAYIASAATLYIVPPYFALQRDMGPIPRGALAMQICVNAFKLHSYFMTNRYLRKLNKSKQKKSYWRLMLDYLDFLRMPTLVYERNFPRKDKIDVVYIMKETAGMLICFLSMYLVVQKFLMPYLEIVDEIPFYELVYLLGIPTLFLWVIGFYGVFHCMLNVIAEVARFEDREFYLDWWASTSMSEFWRLWNRAVYKFMCRHIYLESMRQVPFFNKWWASASTFVTTAILHEYVLVVAFGFLRPYFFTMICLQIPFVYFTDYFLKGLRLGNIVMWAGLILGFPMLELSYTYSYFHKSIKLL